MLGRDIAQCEALQWNHPWIDVSRIVPILDQPNSKYTSITTTQNAFDLDFDTPKVVGNSCQRALTVNY